MLIDTHCHIHETEYPLDAEEVLQRARAQGVMKLICVGTSERSSTEAVEFAKNHENIFASVGVHPHESKDGWATIEELVRQPVVAIGEIGLDYCYTHSPREHQIRALEAQLQIAVTHDLPVIFHVREAFSDFWPIFDNFSGLRGVLHSFTDTQIQMDQGLKRGLYVGVNGISTFTKDPAQQKLFRSIPLERMVLETDAPFLTPVPKRGTVNEPAFVSYVAERHAAVRGVTPDDIARSTSANASALFAL